MEIIRHDIRYCPWENPRKRDIYRKEGTSVTTSTNLCLRQILVKPVFIFILFIIYFFELFYVNIQTNMAINLNLYMIYTSLRVNIFMISTF